VRYIKYDQEKPPEVQDSTVKVYHHLLGRDLELEQDLVVLSTPLVAAEDNESLSKLLRVTLDENKFFLEAHVKLKPLDFATDGVYLCGNAHYPATVREAISHRTNCLRVGRRGCLQRLWALCCSLSLRRFGNRSDR
jgi:heterodisulfide reductase subunit A